MALKCGIVGLPNVGKSTLFNALSSNAVEAANFPFCTIKPNTGVVHVPDNRLDVLKELVNPLQVIPVTFEFVDIAGLVRGASKGEGLGNQFLAAIREVDAIVHVVRCFEDTNIVHVNGKVDPVSDKEIIDTELQIKDLDSLEKKIYKLERTVKGGDAKIKKELTSLFMYREALHRGESVNSVEATESDREAISDLRLLTDKPILYVANVKEEFMEGGNEYVDQLKRRIAGENSGLIILCAAIEAQIALLDSAEDRQAFLEEYGLQASGLSKLIRSTYDLLGLITYFTAGEKEVRAWTVSKGWKAPQAAGVIHSDFEKGFIKAEVIKLPDYQQYGSEAGCREAGKLFIEGKEYVVQDGDIMHFRFNV